MRSQVLFSSLRPLAEKGPNVARVTFGKAASDQEQSQTEDLPPPLPNLKFGNVLRPGGGGRFSVSKTVSENVMGGFRKLSQKVSLACLSALLAFAP
eukprot:5982766-Amphidinium_carterae.1